MTPPSPAPASAEQGSAAAAPPAEGAASGQASAVQAPPASPPPSAAPMVAEQDTRVSERRPLKGPRHSTGMMVGGIVMTSFTPIALLVAWVADIEQNSCERGNYSFDGSTSSLTRGANCSAYDKTIYGGLISAVVLAGVGIPLIVIGGKREPLGSTAKISPWATPQGAGVGLRIDL